MKLSVVIATYNGETFLKEQVDSILKQLDADSEIIISDDGSTDETKNIIRQYKDKRIVLIENETSSGVIKNFERGLKHASGDIIFLSDQDDIWLPGKVKICRNYLQKYDLVVTDCKVVNENLEILNDSYFQISNSGKGLFKNLIKNTYLGSCMAFKKKLLNETLPFPEKIPMHDIWIGFVAECFFKSYFINEQLSLYRRHGSNASVTTKKSDFSFVQKMQFRWNTTRYLPHLFLRKNYRKD